MTRALVINVMRQMVCTHPQCRDAHGLRILRSNAEKNQAVKDSKTFGECPSMTEDASCNRRFERIPTEVAAEIIIEGFPYPQALISNISEGGAFLCINLTCFDIFDCLSRFEGAPATILASLRGHMLPLQGVIRRTHTNTFSVVFKSSRRTKVITRWLMDYAQGDESVVDRMEEVLNKVSRPAIEEQVPTLTPAHQKAAEATSKRSDATPQQPLYAGAQQRGLNQPTPSLAVEPHGADTQGEPQLSENSAQRQPTVGREHRAGVIAVPQPRIVRTDTITATSHMDDQTRPAGSAIAICGSSQSQGRAKFLLPDDGLLTDQPLGSPTTSASWALIPK